MKKLAKLGLCSAALLALLGSCTLDADVAATDPAISIAVNKPFFLTSPEAIIPPPPEKLVGDLLKTGVVIVVSKPSQEMHVFRYGNLWKTSKVSTGRKGNDTPAGVFAILQKREEHFSNLYDDAPMPFMQRLTWDGIALHAGAVPGYPASHGCVRMPLEFAEELFEITSFGTTAVIISDAPTGSTTAALSLAHNTDEVVPIHPSVFGYKWAS